MDRLVQQRHGSSHTIGAYRDAWRLMVRFAADDLTTAPSKLKLSDLDSPLIGGSSDTSNGPDTPALLVRNVISPPVAAGCGAGRAWTREREAATTECWAMLERDL